MLNYSKGNIFYSTKVTSYEVDWKLVSYLSSLRFDFLIGCFLCFWFKNSAEKRGTENFMIIWTQTLSTGFVGCYWSKFSRDLNHRASNRNSTALSLVPFTPLVKNTITHMM